MKKRLSNLVKSSVIGVMIASMLCVNVFAGTASVDRAPEANTEVAVQTAVSSGEIISGEAFSSAPKYSYKRLDKTMYVKSAVNVRNMPCKAGTKLCKLSKAKRVYVTGKCKQTGWYRIRYNGKTGYVPSKYLVSKKPKTDKKNTQTQSQTGANNSSTTTVDNSNVEMSKADRIKSIIHWEADYSEELENAVISEMNKLPEKIFNDYFDVYQKSINIVPSLDQYGEDIIGHIEWTTFDGRVVIANMSFENNLFAIQSSVLHEIGHYVEVAYGYAGGDTSLPNFEADAYRFSIVERNGNTYYASSEKEYFAELFAYTIDNGVTSSYEDTNKMQFIIDNFTVLPPMLYPAA